VRGSSREADSLWSAADEINAKLVGKVSSEPQHQKHEINCNNRVRNSPSTNSSQASDATHYPFKSEFNQGMKDQLSH
jgi:hypothetical protein